jgi:hypothetical protein
MFVFNITSNTSFVDLKRTNVHIVIILHIKRVRNDADIDITFFVVSCLMYTY